MNAALFERRLWLVFHLFSLFHTSFEGNCWSAMSRNERCTELLHAGISREQCCAQYGPTTAWSEGEPDPGTLFFWRVLGDGVPCQPCRDSCDEVECGAGKTCAVRKGHPRCICSGKCKDGRQRMRGPICGSDGRTYRNVCRLKKKACKRRFHTDLSLAYTGTCQSSCDRIRCPSGKSCLLDQNLGAHCVKCVKQCPVSTKKRRQVCGSDGRTYASSCHLRETACHLGKAIPIAYKGPCREGATCKKVQCREQQSCLVDRNKQTPRCVSCSLSCKPRHLHGPICGSNNSTYRSWCHMMQDACGKGYVIETKHSGHCGKDTKL